MSQTINIATVTAASGTLADIKIGKIVLGGLTIGQLSLQGTAVDIKSGSAYLTSVQILITLDFTFDWWYNIGFFSGSGSDNLGSLGPIPLDLGDVSIPALSNIPLNIPNIVFSNITAAVAPFTSVDLGGANFTGLTATTIVVPKSGFTLTGLGLGNVSVSSVTVPEATVAQVSVTDFQPKASIVLPSATLGPLNLPSGSASDIQTTAAINIPDATATSRGLSINLGVFGGTIWVTPVAQVSIGSLVLHGVTLSASVAQAVLANIGVTVDVQGIDLSTVDISQVDVSNITL
jgi:hypothetical protein